MAYRCDGCCKMCGVEQIEPEIDGEDITTQDGEFSVSGSVRIALQSTCCGEEIDGAEADIEFEFESGEVSHIEAETDICKECDFIRGEHTDETWEREKKEAKHPTPKHDFHWDLVDHDFSIESIEAEANDWYEGKGGPRFQKHYWGADISGSASCDTCGVSVDIDVTQVGEQAGAFDQYGGGSYSRNAARKRRAKAAAKAAAETPAESN